MNSFEFEAGELRPLTLQPQQRVMLGGRAGGVAEPLPERISIGQAKCGAVERARVDAETRRFLDGKTASAFWLLELTCSFIADEGEPLERAWLKLQLTASPPEAAEPLAWSMEPRSLGDPEKVSKKTSFDASLKLKSETVPLEAGPAVSRETTREHTKQVPFVEAHGEGTATPSWIFDRTPITEIRGIHHLRTIVEAPAAGTTEGKISIGATVRRKRLGLVPYEADLEDLPEHRSITLAAATAG